MSERDVMRLITDYLSARRILHFRNQVGASVSSYRGKTRVIRFGTVGMADYVAYQPEKGGGQRVTWIEAKAEEGKQRPEQKAFQKIVEDHDHRYIVVRGYEDLEKMFGAVTTGASQ